jgi:hypothetical protein
MSGSKLRQTLSGGHQQLPTKLLQRKCKLLSRMAIEIERSNA